MRQPWYPRSAKTLSAAWRMARRFSGSPSAGGTGCGASVRLGWRATIDSRVNGRLRGPPWTVKRPERAPPAGRLGDQREAGDGREVEPGGDAVVPALRHLHLDEAAPAIARGVPGGGDGVLLHGRAHRHGSPPAAGRRVDGPDREEGVPLDVEAPRHVDPEPRRPLPEGLEGHRARVEEGIEAGLEGGRCGGGEWEGVEGEPGAPGVGGGEVDADLGEVVQESGVEG